MATRDIGIAGMGVSPRDEELDAFGLPKRKRRSEPSVLQKIGDNLAGVVAPMIGIEQNRPAATPVELRAERRRANDYRGSVGMPLLEAPNSSGGAILVVNPLEDALLGDAQAAAAAGRPLDVAAATEGFSPERTRFLSERISAINDQAKRRRELLSAGAEMNRIRAGETTGFMPYAERIARDANLFLQQNTLEDLRDRNMQGAGQYRLLPAPQGAGQNSLLPAPQGAGQNSLLPAPQGAGQNSLLPAQQNTLGDSRGRNMQRRPSTLGNTRGVYKGPEGLGSSAYRTPGQEAAKEARIRAKAARGEELTGSELRYMQGLEAAAQPQEQRRPGRIESQFNDIDMLAEQGRITPEQAQQFKDRLIQDEDQGIQRVSPLDQRMSDIDAALESGQINEDQARRARENTINEMFGFREKKQSPYQTRVSELQQRLDAGEITQDEYNVGLRFAQQRFLGIEPDEQSPYDSRVSELKQQLDSGEITQNEYNLGLRSAQKQFLGINPRISPLDQRMSDIDSALKSGQINEKQARTARENTINEKFGFREKKQSPYQTRVSELKQRLDAGDITQEEYNVGLRSAQKQFLGIDPDDVLLTGGSQEPALSIPEGVTEAHVSAVQKRMGVSREEAIALINRAMQQ